eukprot:scaffold2470_cov21-Tisochrysis_lutea.AAC.3
MFVNTRLGLFAQVDGLRVFGVAIPTVAGLRRALNSMGAQRGKRCVYWQNLREEPLIFINGHPFVVREADKPFSNLEYTGEGTGCTVLVCRSLPTESLC